MRGTNVPPTRFDKRVDVSTSMAPLHCELRINKLVPMQDPQPCVYCGKEVSCGTPGTGDVVRLLPCGHSACASCALMDAFDAARDKPVRSCLCVCLVSAKRGIGPGCWPTEVGGPAGRLRAALRAHGRFGQWRTVGGGR
jgi:hypothetical protein